MVIVGTPASHGEHLMKLCLPHSNRPAPVLQESGNQRVNVRPSCVLQRFDCELQHDIPDPTGEDAVHPVVEKLRCWAYDSVEFGISHQRIPHIREATGYLPILKIISAVSQAASVEALDRSDKIVVSCEVQVVNFYNVAEDVSVCIHVCKLAAHTHNIPT